MRLRRIIIDKDSKGTIFGMWLFLAALAVCAILFIGNLWIRIPILLILLATAFFVFWFHRVPDRDIPEGDESLVTSVADGKVVIVERVYEKEYFKSDCIQVSVYMDFWDLHANFWPVTGDVVFADYYPGKHMFAFKPKASEENEHSCTVIRTPAGKEVAFKQLAGGFARRIVCYATPGLEVRAGEQCGIIKFGSRIDYFLPADAKVCVKVGDLVKAVTSVIAEI